MTNRKVNLFLVGAMRAGTTSLVDLLSKHPDIYVPPIKEPNYFTADLPKELYTPPRNFSIDSYFEKDFPHKRLHIAHIKKKEHYEKLYSGAANEKYLLDASTAYLHAPGVAQRIYKYNPEAKIIVLLRDPFERMVSHYKMDIGLGRKFADFEILVDDQINRYKLGKLQWYEHLAMSIYKEPLDQFRSYFRAVGIYNLSDINRSSDLDQLFDFLGVEKMKGTMLGKVNQSISPISMAKGVGVYSRTIKPFLSTKLSKKGGEFLKKGISSLPKRTMRISEVKEKELTRIFNQGTS